MNSAGIRYIKEEYQGIYVGGQYGIDTKNAFKSLRRGTSNLDPDAIEDLKTAFQVSVPQTQGRNNFHNRPFRGGFRGRGRGSFRGRGGSGSSSGYQQKNVPFQKENNYSREVNYNMEEA